MHCHAQPGKLLRARTPHRRGLVLIAVALLFIVMIGMLGLAIDTLYAVRTAQQLQAAADASALAGALLVREDAAQAVAKAVQVAAANTAAGAPVELHPAEGYLSGEVVLGRYYRKSPRVLVPYFEPTLDAPNAVSVLAQRTPSNGHPLPLLFGPIFGVQTISLSRDAIAMIGGGTGSGLIVLDPSGCETLKLNGSALVLDVMNDYGEGAIQVNSACATATVHSGQPTIMAQEVNIAGGTDKGFQTQVNLNCPLNLNSKPVPDPLAFLRDFPLLPQNHDPQTAPANPSGTVTLYPGYYAAGLRSTNSGATIIMGPGIYLFDGQGFVIEGGNVTADGVLIYVLDTTPADNLASRLYLGGNGIIHITPYVGGVYDGLAIWQAYGNTSPSTIIGTGNLDLQGTLYFPDTAQLELGGSGMSAGNQLIANRLYIHGTGTFTINYDGRNPAPGNKVFLVE